MFWENFKYIVRNYVGCSIKSEKYFFPQVVILVTNKVHQLIALIKTNPPAFHLIVFQVFLLVLWNPEILSLKITWEKMSNEKSENLWEQCYIIKFCVKFKKMVTEKKKCQAMSTSYTNAKRTQKCILWRCRRTAFAFIRLCGVWWTGECYLSGVDTSKKNTFAIILMWMYAHSGSQWITSRMLACSLVWRMLNKQLFGIRSHSPRSRMPCSCLRTDVDTP